MRCAIAAALVALSGVIWLLWGSEPEGVADGSAPIRQCDAGSSAPPFASTGADLVIGPLRVVAFRRLFANARAADVYTRRDGRTKVLKAAVNIVGDRDVTIVVPRRLRGLLSLDYGLAGTRPAVRFQACPRGRRTTGYAGAWLYKGPWPACVALRSRIEGRADAVRRRVPLGAGRCAQPR